MERLTPEDLYRSEFGPRKVTRNRPDKPYVRLECGGHWSGDRGNPARKHVHCGAILYLPNEEHRVGSLRSTIAMVRCPSCGKKMIGGEVFI